MSRKEKVIITVVGIVLFGVLVITIMRVLP